MLVRDASQFYPCRTANDFLGALNAQYAEAARELGIEFRCLQEVYTKSGYGLITIKNSKGVMFLEDPVVLAGTDGEQDIDLSVLSRRSRLILIADGNDYAVIGPDVVPAFLGDGYARKEGWSTLVIYDRNGQKKSQPTFSNGSTEKNGYNLSRIGKVREYLLENFPGYFDPRMLVEEKAESGRPF